MSPMGPNRLAGNRRLFLMAGLLVSLVITILVVVYGPRQVWISQYCSFDGDSILHTSVGTEMGLLWIVDGPKWGSVVLQSVDVLDYEGLSIKSVQFLRTDRGASGVVVPSDPHWAMSALEMSRLRDVNGTRLQKNVKEPLVENDCLIVNVLQTSTKASGPLRCRISYRWFGIPFAVEYP